MTSQIDLHSHSTISDGLLAPDALVAYAASKGVQVLALTDHDDVAGLGDAEAAAQAQGVAFIRGVEISVTWHRRTLHIVGLKVDPAHEPLYTGLKRIRDSRHARAEGMAHGLARAGIAGSLEGAYSHATKGGIISRSHFARWLVEKGYANDVRSVFKRFLVPGKPGYFEHKWADLEEAVQWITGSGGIAVIAHPGRYDLGRTRMLELFNEFRDLGGKAVEVVTGSHTVEQYREFARLAHQFDLCASSGSDYHGPGMGYMDMGRLPALPHGCTPVWHDWAEIGERH